MSSPEYLYLIAKPVGRETELIRAESLALTGTWPDELGIAVSNRFTDTARGAYVLANVEILLSVSSKITLDLLYQQICQLGLQGHNFCVRIIKRPKKIPLSFDQFEVANQIGVRIDGPANLSKPEMEFWLIITPRRFWFGLKRSISDKQWTHFNKRPHTTSSSLPSRIARAMVNLTVNPGDRLLDPCCGTGTILLEGANMGLQVFGCDLNLKMKEATRKNLAHFGLSGAVVLADARQISSTTFGHPFNAIVTDLPYGISLVKDEERDRQILANIRMLAPRATFVSARDLSQDLENLGYQIETIVQVPKHDRFVRQVFVTRSVSG